MSKLIFLSFIWLLLVSVKVNGDTECFSSRTDFYNFFSTKTSYFSVVNNNQTFDDIQFEGCDARSFWLLARHGTRNPGKKDIKKFAKNALSLKNKIVENNVQSGAFCDEDMRAFQQWTFNLTPDDESLLTESGQREQFEIGQRFKSRLGDLLKGPYNTNNFLFKFTHKARTIESARGFVRGTFPEAENLVIPKDAENLETDDDLLRFYDFCPRWINEVEKNSDTYVEQQAFLESHHFRAVVKRVSTKLGFDEDLNSDDIFLMYDICRFEKAWNPDRVSLWCNPFLDEDLSILEYSEELKYWYSSAYTHPVNSEMACPLLVDLVEKFGGDYSKFDDDLDHFLNGSFYFTHSEAMLPFFTLLGLFKDDEIPRHDNYHSMSHRRYRTSLISPFSSNLGFVLFNCDGEKKVLTLHQESHIKLPGCSDVLCSWADFIKIYEDKLDCDLQEICNISFINGAESQGPYLSLQLFFIFCFSKFANLY